MPPTDGALSLKRETFCQRYAVHGNATKAAEEAGYTPRATKQVAHDLLKVPAIQARIAELQGASAARSETDADYVRQQARAVVEACMARTPIDSSGAVSGLNLLAKLGGMFPKQSLEVTGAGGGPLTVHVVREIIDPAGDADG